MLEFVSEYFYLAGHECTSMHYVSLSRRAILYFVLYVNSESEYIVLW